MHHYIAFLRGMNLGNRRIKMDQLRKLFVALGFSDVATFIASGNVVFSCSSSDTGKLESRIAQHLEHALGYRVDTFVRTREQLAGISLHRPFPRHELNDPRNSLHVGFLAQTLGATQRKLLTACRTAVDEFHVKGREFYWLCRIQINESKVWTSPSMKLVRLPSTSMRNVTTIRKMAALYPTVRV